MPLFSTVSIASAATLAAGPGADRDDADRGVAGRDAAIRGQATGRDDDALNGGERLLAGGDERPDRDLDRDDVPVEEHDGPGCRLEDVDTCRMR